MPSRHLPGVTPSVEERDLESLHGFLFKASEEGRGKFEFELCMVFASSCLIDFQSFYLLAMTIGDDPTQISAAMQEPLQDNSDFTLYPLPFVYW